MARLDRVSALLTNHGLNTNKYFGRKGSVYTYSSNTLNSLSFRCFCNKGTESHVYDGVSHLHEQECPDSKSLARTRVSYIPIGSKKENVAKYSASSSSVSISSTPRSWKKSKAIKALSKGEDGYAKGSNWFPYTNSFDLGLSKALSSKEVIDILEPFILETRKSRIAEVIKQRTFQLVPVVEGLSDLGNVSAVSRTAEAFGLQSMHVISNLSRKRYKDNRAISKGTDKWLDVEVWSTTDECFQILRQRGYRIAVTHLSDQTVPIYDLDWTIPTAVVFGNEFMGISAKAIKGSDVAISIPMAGMVDSFNISVAAGITLHHAVQDRIKRRGYHGDISEEQQEILKADFLLRSNRHTKGIIEHLLTEKGAVVGQKDRAPKIIAELREENQDSLITLPENIL